MDYIFAPSLLGPRQDAILALYTCWGDESDCTPPLTAMMAVMLRRPTLDKVRCAEPPPDVIDNNDAQIHAQSSLLLELVAADDAEAIGSVMLSTVSPRAFSTQLACQHLVWTLLDAAALIAWRTHAYRALVVLIKRLTAEYSRSSTLCGAPSKSFFQSKTFAGGAAPLIQFRETVFPLTLQAICSSTSVPVLAKEFVDVTVLHDALCSHFAAVSEACARLPMGDVRALLERHRHDADYNGFLADVLAYAARGAFSVADAQAALMQLGHGDVAAMLFAVAPDSDALELSRIHAAARDVEFPTARLNHVYIDGSHEYVTAGAAVPYGRLMKAFNGDGTAAVRPARVASVADDHAAWRHILLSRIAAMSLRRCAPAPYRARSDFERHWNWQLRGLLGDDWDWSNCVAAGGAVVRALVGPEVDTADPQDPAETPFGDVNLFFYGLTTAEQRRRLQQLERHVRRTVGAGRYAVLLTTFTMTIVVEDAPRLHMLLGRWSSIADVLSTCNVDCCGAGYDGRDVWLTGRAAVAYATRTNVADAAVSSVVWKSMTYEMRLWKYAARFGFAVLDPLHNAATAATARAKLAKAAAEKARRRAKRNKAEESSSPVATNLSGLRWLMAVDDGLLEPVDAAGDLAVGGSATLATVMAKVRAAGYMPDRAGKPETGYLVVLEDAAAEQTSPEVPPVESYAHRWINEPRLFLFANTPPCNHNFAVSVGLRDHNAVDLKTIDVAAWKL